MSETLKKITYDNIDQFLQDINRNFGVIQNSPLYKGVPGSEGIDGNPGLRGIRGSQFLFVNYAKFNLKFPNELANASKIDLNFINLKLLSFASKAKLLEALNITEFVNNDIIVLTNSIMLSFNNNDNIFVDTGLAFNEQSNLVSSIETKIQDYVELYVSQNITLAGLKNIFTDFDTYAKNYADTNNTYITTELTASSVYVPYYEGLTTTNGIKLTNHKYFGFTDAEIGRDSNGTMVFGSIKKYIDLLVATVSITDNQTLTSDYAPGVDNIPTAVFLQDTARAGIMIGRKARTNLRTFAQIYKNVNDELVIQSDSGPESTNPSNDYSKLILSRLKMSFDKAVEFKDNLTVNKDLSVLGNINNRFIRTNEFTSDQVLNSVEIGSEVPTGNPSSTQTYTRFISKNLKFRNFPGQVLVTDNNSDLIKTYSIETQALTSTETNILTQITNLPSSSSKVVTSNYINFLMTKFNNLSLFLNNLNTFLGTVWDSGDFTIENIGIVGSQSNALTPITNIPSATKSKVVTSDYLNFIFTKFNNLESYLYTYINNLNAYVATSWDTSDFQLENTSINGAEVGSMSYINNIPTATKSRVVTSDYLNFTFNKFNNLISYLNSTFNGYDNLFSNTWFKSNFSLENQSIITSENQWPATITQIMPATKSKVVTSDYLTFIFNKFNNLKSYLDTKFNGYSVGGSVIIGSGNWQANNFLFLNGSTQAVTKNAAEMRSLMGLGNTVTFNFESTGYGYGTSNGIARGDHTFHRYSDIWHHVGQNAEDLSNPDTINHVRLIYVESQPYGGPWQGYYYKTYVNWSGANQWMTFPLWYGDSSVACPYIYTILNEKIDFYSEILKNQNNLDFDKEEILEFSTRFIENNQIKLKIKEEKDEISFINYIKLSINNIDILPENNPFNKKYIVLRKGESIDLIFNISEKIENIDSIKLIGKGYYQPLSDIKFK